MIGVVAVGIIARPVSANPFENREGGILTRGDDHVADPEFDEGQPWYTDEMPDQAETITNAAPVKATDLIGRDYDDPLWDEFMDQIPVDTLRDVIISGFFWTIAIPEVDLPMSITPDGPTGFVQGSGQNRVSNTCRHR